MVARGRIELPTRGFSVHCSTNWATWPFCVFNSFALSTRVTENRDFQSSLPCCFAAPLRWPFVLCNSIHCYYKLDDLKIEIFSPAYLAASQPRYAGLLLSVISFIDIHPTTVKNRNSYSACLIEWRFDWRRKYPSLARYSNRSSLNYIFLLNQEFRCIHWQKGRH